MKPGSDRMDDIFARLLSRRDTQGRKRRLTLPPQGAVDFSSNSYLSLAANPELKKRFISLLQSSGEQFSLGSGGSRLLDGNNTFTEDLESRIAAFHNAPTGLLFNSGFDANSGLFGCAPQPGDVVVYDELIHASVHDGMKLGRAQKVPFAHNCVDATSQTTTTAGPGSLRAVLDQLCDGRHGGAYRDGKRNIFIAVEGVYSMDGDVAPLKEIVSCVRQRLPLGNGHIIVDEAHSTGIIGDRGRGLVCHLGLEDQVWARVHTFGKAMGCAGGKFFLVYPKSHAHNTNFNSDCALLPDDAVLPHQLRTKPHLHNRDRVSVAGSDPNNLRIPGRWVRGRLAPEPPDAHLPGAWQSIDHLRTI